MKKGKNFEVPRKEEGGKFRNGNKISLKELMGASSGG